MPLFRQTGIWNLLFLYLCRALRNLKLVSATTILRFVPLCGDAFDWQDVEESTSE